MDFVFCSEFHRIFYVKQYDIPEYLNISIAKQIYSVDLEAKLHN